MTHEELVRAINKYLTERFIWPHSAEMPPDECETEARAILPSSPSERKSRQRR